MAHSRKNRFRTGFQAKFQFLTREQLKKLRARDISRIEDFNKILCWFPGEKHPTFTQIGLAVRYGGGRGKARITEVPGGYTIVG